ncbi:hypothetical protein QFC21_000957 [Naganishia friedmannii]|uniref:Uncharacterized protein n=1 Tax=Naganishia friedmannii TaxID=89922 RepID=A0ACC2W8S4_9TREE|nr:hypothetical protein QFC21_000957 [Naganishia friedmannii]
MTCLAPLLQLLLLLAVVIDDSQWNTHALQLSNGWNMLRPDQIEAIDQFQVQLMKPLLPMFYNRSISWTSRQNANVTVQFTGKAITVVGARGPAGSDCTLILDGKTLPDGCSTRAPDFIANQTLFQYDGLASGIEHNLTMINSGEGFMYIDYANITDSLPAPVIRLPGLQTPLVSTAPGVLMSSSSGASPATNVAAPLATARPLPMTAELLHPSYTFNWNSRVYFVFLFGATMLVLIIGMVIHHRHEEARNRQLLTAGSFMGAAGASKTSTLKSRFNKLNSVRKSKISAPMQDVEFTAGGAGHAREVSEGSDKFGVSSWNSHDRLRHDKQTSISSGREGQRRGNQMTLGEALNHDNMAFPRPPAPPQ